MRTPKATKLKSGNWRIQIQIDGRRYSCTGATKKEAQEKAKQIFATMIEECANSIDRNLLRFVTVEGSSLPPELWYQQRIFFWKLSQMRG